jgi:hypothetical protein
MQRNAFVELDMAAFDYSADGRIAGAARPSTHSAIPAGPSRKPFRALIGTSADIGLTLRIFRGDQFG